MLVRYEFDVHHYEYYTLNYCFVIYILAQDLHVCMFQLFKAIRLHLDIIQYSHLEINEFHHLTIFYMCAGILYMFAASALLFRPIFHVSLNDCFELRKWKILQTIILSRDYFVELHKMLFFLFFFVCIFNTQDLVDYIQIILVKTCNIRMTIAGST